MKIIVVSNDLDFSRIIVIPVKNFGTAIKRNLNRRQYKEIYRLNKYSIKKGFDIAAIIYKGKDFTYEEKEKDFLILLGKANLLA